MSVTTQLVKKLRNITGAGILDCKKALEANDGKIEEAIKWLREKGISKAAKKSDRVAAEGLVGLVNKGDKTVIFEVNSETDFVAKNKQFLYLMAIVGETLINHEPKTVEDALKILINGDTLENVIVHSIATIGEKITLRRFKTIHLKEDQSIGFYLHYNNRIATVLIFSGKIEEKIGKQLAMHVSAMRPQFISRNDISVDFLNSEKAILKYEAENDQKNIGKPDNILEKMVEGRINKKLAEISFLDQFFVFKNDKKISDVIKENNVRVFDMIRYEVGEGIEKEEGDFT